MPDIFDSIGSGGDVFDKVAPPQLDTLPSHTPGARVIPQDNRQDVLGIKGGRVFKTPEETKQAALDLAGTAIDTTMGVSDGVTLGLTKPLTDKARQEMPNLGLTPNPAGEAVGHFAGVLAPWTGIGKAVEASFGLANAGRLGQIATQSATGAIVGATEAGNSGRDIADEALLGGATAGAFTTLFQLPGAVKALKESTWYRELTIPERGLVVQSLDDVAAGLKKQGWTDGQIEAKLARLSPEEFQASLERRMQGVNTEPSPIPEAGAKAETPPEVKFGAPAIEPAQKAALPDYVPEVNTGGLDYLDRIMSSTAEAKPVVSSEPVPALPQVSESLPASAEPLPVIPDTPAVSAQIPSAVAPSTDMPPPPTSGALISPESQGVLQQPANQVTPEVLPDIQQQQDIPMSGSAHADTGGYNLNPPGPQSAPFANQEVKALDLPEMVELAQKLRGGEYPKIFKKLRAKGALGLFRPGNGDVELLAKLSKTPGLLERVLAHEVGHLVDWLPDHDIKRGNILGRVASLKRYMKTLLEEYEGAPGILTPKDRARIREEAKAELKANERPDETIIETITREVPQWKYVGIDSEMIKAIWNDVAAREKFPKLYRAISELSDGEKKAVLVQAMKGLVDERLSHFGERVQVGTETVTEEVSRTIPGVQATPEQISKRYAELIQEEIDKRNLYKREVISQELKDLTLHWKPFTPGNNDFTKYRFSSVELYADAFSVLINDPALLRKIAPTFEKAFFSYLHRKPEVSGLYYELQDMLKNPETVQPHRQENVRGMFEKGEAAKKETERRPVNEFLKKIYRDLVDVNADLNWKVKEAKKNGAIIPDDENPQYWVEQLPYISADVYNHLSMIQSGILAPLEKAGLSMDDLGEYMFYKRITGDRADLANPLGHTGQTAEAGLEHLQQQLGPDKFAAIEKLAGEYRAIREKNVIAFMEKAEMWSEDLMNHVKDNDEYVTFSVVKFLEDRFGRGATAQVYTQVGTLQEIRNPFIATVMKDAALIRAANIKLVKKVTTDFLSKNFPSEIAPADTRWNGKGHEPVEPKDPNQKLLLFPHKGEIQGYYIPKGIAETFEQNPYHGGVVARVLSIVSQIPRNVMVSRNPAWMVANLPRDFVATWKQIPGVSLLDLLNYYRKASPHAWADAMKGEQSKLVSKMLRDKELVTDRQFTAIEESPDDELNRMLEQFGKNPVQYRNKVIKPLVWIWDHLGKLGKFTERVVKIAGHMALEDQGVPHMRRAHLVRSRVGTPDVHRGGRLRPIYNNLFLFSNVAKEGWRSSWESAKESPGTYAWKTAMFNMLPKILLKAAALGMMGAGVKEIIDKTGEYYKANYTVVPVGLDKNGKAVVLTIPQDYSGQVAGGLFWKALNMDWGGEKGLFSYATEQTPYGLNPVISLAADAVQVMRGQNPYDSYRGQNVVPDTVWAAQDHRSIEALLKYEWNQVGGSALYRFSGDGPDRAESELQKVMKLPGGNVLGRFLRVTDQGEREALREIAGEVKKEAARKSLDVREAIIEDINDKGGKPVAGDMVKLYRKLLDEKVIDFDTKFSEFRPRYERYKAGTENSAKVDAVVNASGNKEKAALLQHYKESMPAEKYQQIEQQLILEGHVKKGTMKELIFRDSRAQ